MTSRRVALLSALALASCGGGQALADAAPPAATPSKDPGPRESQAGISLALTVDTPKLAVGDALRFQLAFHNSAGAGAVVVPPLDGSWDGFRQPLYELVFSDASGQPLPHALGFADSPRCGLVNPLTPSDLLALGARGTLALKDAQAWAPPFNVLEHARPGRVMMRVHYRAKGLPGATSLDLVSNAVELTITGGNEALWACRNAQAERAERHAYAENAPSRLVARGDGYLLVYRRTETHVRPEGTSSTGAVLVQRLGPTGEPIGDAVEIARSDKDWLGLVETIEVPDGLLVAFTSPRGAEDRDVRIVHVDTSQAAPRPAPATTIAAEPGRPVFLTLARSGDRAAIAWQGRAGASNVLRFRPIDAHGEPKGSAVSIPASAGFAGGRALLEPMDRDFLLAWQQGGPELRLQRITPDGGQKGSAGSVKLADAGSLVALGPRADRIGLVYADSGVNHQVAGDTMGLHELALAPGDFRVLSDTACSPLDQTTARFGAAGWVDGRLARVWGENQSLFFASAPGASAPRVALSAAERGTHGLWPTADKSRVLVAWTDARDDDQRRCASSSDCVSEVYVAVLDPAGKVLVPPTRATRTAVPRPISFVQQNWRDFCGTAASTPATPAK